MPLGQRARRIPDAEWDQWRTELVRLYMEECASRKEIIEFMARDHNFVITETQLKHRFEKWDVKKNISDEDMTTMLALKRKRQAIGKDIRFQYKGHIVEQERMERADKRQKRDLRSPTFIQPYIKVFDSRHQSPQDPTNVFASSHNAEIDTSLVRSALASSFGTCDRVHPVINADTVLAPSPRMNSALYQGSHSADPSHIHEDVVMTEAPNILTIGSVEPDMFRDIRRTPGPTDSYYAIGMADDLDSLRFQTPARTSRSDSMHRSESGWQALVEWSPSGRSPAGALSRPSRELSHEGSHSDGSLSPGGGSSRLPPREMRDPLGSDVLERFATPQSGKELQGIGSVIANGIDWDSITLPLLLLKSHLSATLDGSQRRHVCKYSSSASAEALFEILRGSWLWAKLEDVVYWDLKASAQAIRERRDHKANKITPTSPPSTVTSQSRNSSLRRREGSDTRVKTHAYIISEGPAGRLRITYSTPIRPIRDEDAGNSLPELTLTFLPTAPINKTALTIVFPISPTLQRSSISPYIKSFNVVPRDSAIMKAVECNDLKAVQQLFDMNKASPLDVDPSGFSLLSYATKAKGLDVFRLLLQGGASTQNCNGYPNSLDIIWATWSRFLAYDADVDVLSDCAEMEYDFEHCVSITDTALAYGCHTDTALAYGCHIEDTTPYYLDYPNALFEISSAWPLRQLDPPLIEEIIQYLIIVGYDLERSNQTGLTPLLSAARSHFPQVIRCLRACIKVGANLHAVDLKGRGALFQAIAPPTVCNDWNGSLLPWQVEYLSSTGTSNLFLADFFKTELELYAVDYSDAVEEEDVEADFVIAECEHGYQGLIQDPVFVLKKRTRVKLLTLLKAGCDPNALDHAGLSPSDEAIDCGLWSEWTWALRKAGYVYDVIRDCWKKA